MTQRPVHPFRGVPLGAWLGIALAVFGGAPVPAQDFTTDSPGELTPEERAEDALTAAMLAPWTGDLDGMVKRGFIRVGVGNEPMFFSYDGPEQQGLTVDAMREFEKHLRATLGPEATLTVTLAPLPRDRLTDALVAGEVDILAANLDDYAGPRRTGGFRPARPEERVRDRGDRPCRAKGRLAGRSGGRGRCGCARRAAITTTFSP